eukprot:CAMPEP_0204367198 /NCGR_PEP_ID=MMETSP0469-20131031/43238_1 /ASSEMBLY_ACC=CAM_ASM_000384 /TAXON_ID=2969 /ORGANISM="Oxyrrhis marina" /LENGTH=91 /DNA_ID=CAMNT_0051356541 /DNA_START=112 /DNA_END=383 /DNA_ORIENTATION=+
MTLVFKDGSPGFTAIVCTSGRLALPTVAWVVTYCVVSPTAVRRTSLETAPTFLKATSTWLALPAAATVNGRFPYPGAPCSFDTSSATVVSA